MSCYAGIASQFFAPGKPLGSRRGGAKQLRALERVAREWADDREFPEICEGLIELADRLGAAAADLDE